MDFVLWVCRLMHVVSVVVWVGGLIFLNAILIPVAEHDRVTRSATVMAVEKRFLPFVWFSLWTLFVTGIIMMLLSPRFIWFDYSTLWSKLLAIKQLSFLCMGFFSWQASKVFAKMEEVPNGDQELFEGWRLGFTKLVKRSIFFGLVALMCAAGMMVA